MRIATVVLLFGLVSLFSGCIREEGQPVDTTPSTTAEPTTPSTAAEPTKPSIALEPAAVSPTVKSGTVPTAAISGVAPLTDATIEVGCGKCVYKIEGVQTCALAAKIGDKPMLLVGDNLKAPAELGVCEAAKSATVSGKVEEGKFLASKVELK